MRFTLHSETVHITSAITALNNATANELVTVAQPPQNLTLKRTEHLMATLAVTGNITATTITLSMTLLLVPNDGNIGSASANDAMQISSPVRNI